MDSVYQYKDADISSVLPVSFKDIDGRKGIVTGYFADFGTVDSDGDVIRKGAFTKTLSESGPLSSKPRIKHILNHNWEQPLGKITTLQEDAKGLYYESQLGTHDLAVNFIKMIDSGLITEHSIGYRTVKYNQVTPWSDWKRGDVARELTELKLYEGSSLTFLGANPNTPLLGIKGEQKADKLAKRIELIIKCLRHGDFTDETCDMLEIELKQIQQLFIDISKTEPLQSTHNNSTQPVKSTEPMPPMAMCDNCKQMTEMPPEDEPMMTCKSCNTQMPNPRRKKSRAFKSELINFLN